MKKKIQYRLLFVLGVLAVGAGLLYFNDLNLGLDLQGGIHLILQVETESAVEAEVEQAQQQLERGFLDEQIGFSDIRGDGRSIYITGVPQDARRLASGYLDTNFVPAWNYSTDSGERGVDFTVTMSESYRRTLATDAVRQARDTVARRIDAYGVAEPTIVVYGSGDVQDQIIVELPGVDDQQRIKELIITLAQLELKLVHPDYQVPFPDRASALNALGGTLPADSEILPYRDVSETGGQLNYMITRRAAVITGSHLKNARRSQDQFTGRNVVIFFLNSDGVSRFSEATGANRGRRLAIVLDDEVVSAPNIEERIDTESARITGSFTVEEADDLALTLKSGALPAKLSILDERFVGPSLGRDSIVRGLYASVLGVILVVLGMLVVYRISGINAIICLVLNLLILMSILAYFRATLTLPGIAGIILTIGMAVDANILIFERIKEELRLGKTVRSAVDSGFDRVFSTILDTNITTLVAALFLFQFGTGPVRGFAVTLAVGLLANIFTATFVSRTLFAFVLQSREVKSLSI